MLSGPLLRLRLAGPGAAGAEGDGGSSPSPPTASPVGLCPKGDMGPRPLHGNMRWAAVGSWDRAVPCLPGAPEHEPVSHKPLSKLL